MIVGCYTIELYCDAEDCTTPRPLKGDSGEHGPHAQFIDELGSSCRQRARKRGWILDSRNGHNTAVCLASTEQAIKSTENVQ